MAGTTKGLRTVFAGTPAFAAAHLASLLESPHCPIAVYTQPDRRAGRGKKLTASPVKQLAEKAGIPVLQPASLKSEDAAVELASLEADLLIVVAYGLILPQAILDTPRLGCINVHASLLPRWRGAAPIQRAVEAGDTETGICIMQMDAGLDTGDVLSRTRVSIDPAMNSGQLHDALAQAGPPLLGSTLDHLEARQASAEPQDDALATYAHKIDKSEAELDFSLPASVLRRRILAFNPFPVAWTTLNGDRLKCWDAAPADGSGTPGEILVADKNGLVVACGEEALRLTRVQLPNGRPMDVTEMLNARRELLAPGTVLGTR